MMYFVFIRNFKESSVLVAAFKKVGGSKVFRGIRSFDKKKMIALCNKDRRFSFVDAHDRSKFLSDTEYRYDSKDKEIALRNALGESKKRDLMLNNNQYLAYGSRQRGGEL